MLRRVDPGFDPKDALTMRINIPETLVKDPEAAMRLEQGILENIRAIPGVTSAGITTVIPTGRAAGSRQVYARDKIYQSVPPLRRLKFISPGLLASMRNRLVAGREFSWTDTYQRRPVAMLSENLARELWGDPRLAIGKQINANPKDPWREVIGVVNDEREDGVQLEAPAVAYYPLLMNQFDGQKFGVMRTVSYIVRSKRAGSRNFVADVQQAVWSLNGTLPLGNVRTLEEIYDKSLARTSFTLLMLAIAGAMALLIGLVGIYGVDLLLSLPALARDRNSRGAGRSPPGAGALVRRSWRRARLHRRGLRISWRSRSDARPHFAAIRRKPARSADLRCRLSRLARSLDRGKLHPNLARHACRPNRCSARGIKEMRCSRNYVDFSKARYASNPLRVPADHLVPADDPVEPAHIADAALPALGTYQIDPVHSFVYFSSWHHIVAVVRGRFDKVTGTITASPDPAACAVDAR